MTKLLEEFRTELNSKDLKLKNTMKDIKKNTIALQDTKKEYAKYVINEDISSADIKFSEIKELEIASEKLNNKRQILSSSKDISNLIELKELAENIKIGNVAEMKKIYKDKLNYRLNIKTIEKEYKAKLKENGTNINNSVSKMLMLSHEINEVLDYVPSYSESQKVRIKKTGSDTILSIEHCSM